MAYFFETQCYTHHTWWCHATLH